MIRANVHGAKGRLSRLIERAEAGEEEVIARNGKPVARLVPRHVRLLLDIDRLMIVQALRHELTFATADRAIRRYAPARLSKGWRT